MLSTGPNLSPHDGGEGGDPFQGVVRPRITLPMITIDGPSASGKTTLGISLAKHYGVPLIDTGAFYRVLGFLALKENIDLDNLGSDQNQREKLLKLARSMSVSFGEIRNTGQQVFLGKEEIGKKIRNNEVSQAASKVAPLEEVRAELNKQIRKLAEGGGILVGRDCGTEFSEASVKVYLEASVEVRALRRMLEYRDGEEKVIDPKSKEFIAQLEEEQQKLEERDRRDRERENSPLRCPKGAIRLNTDSDEPDLVFGQVKVLADSVMHTDASELSRNKVPERGRRWLPDGY